MNPVAMPRVPALTPALHAVVEYAGTPAYAYDLATVLDRLADLKTLGARIFYSPKANPAPAIVRALAARGCGVDACSEFDLALAAAAGVPGDATTFCTHALTDGDLDRCIAHGAHFVADSADQLARYRKHSDAPAGIRVNVGVAAGFHPHVASAAPASSFGIPLDAATVLARDESVGIAGVHCHIGSDVASADAHLRALDRLLAIAAEVPAVRYVNLGGGYRIPFSDDEPPPGIEELARGIRTQLDDFASACGRTIQLRIEPGNYLARDAGYLLVSVLDIRTGADGTRTVITDGSVSALPGALLYGTQHPVAVLGEPAPDATAPALIVGCLMQPGDVLRTAAGLPAVSPGDVLVFGLAGAYCSVRCSTFNGRPLPAEMVITESGIEPVRRRKTADELLAEFSSS